MQASIEGWAQLLPGKGADEAPRLTGLEPIFIGSLTLSQPGMLYGSDGYCSV
jgi:hypothetical protein